MSKVKNFIYEVSVEALPHNQNTVKNIFGENAGYNSDFPEDVHAHENLMELFKDAISGCLMGQLRALKDLKEDQDTNESPLYIYLEKKIKFYETLRDTVKLVRIEDI